jgi:hypothetical protein
LAAFPPQDINSFLELNAGEWMALRSLLGPESGAMPNDTPNPNEDGLQRTETWHQSDRGELSIMLLEPEDGTWGGWDVSVPGKERHRLIFLADGTLRWNIREGRWQMGNDGTLELELQADGRIVSERIWFSKPNLRLRCTLEQWQDGRPGRASFSSEIRRVSRPA